MLPLLHEFIISFFFAYSWKFCSFIFLQDFLTLTLVRISALIRNIVLGDERKYKTCTLNVEQTVSTSL